MRVAVQALPPTLEPLEAISNAKQHGRWNFLRDMPACPPDLAAAAE